MFLYSLVLLFRAWSGWLLLPVTYFSNWSGLALLVDEFDLVLGAATRVGCSLMLLYGLSWSMERDSFSAIFLAAYFYNVSSPLGY